MSFFNFKADIKQLSEESRLMGILDERKRIVEEMLALSEKMQKNGIPANPETMFHSMGYVKALADVGEILRKDLEKYERRT